MLVLNYFIIIAICTAICFELFLESFVNPPTKVNPRCCKRPLVRQGTRNLKHRNASKPVKQGSTVEYFKANHVLHLIFAQYSVEL